MRSEYTSAAAALGGRGRNGQRKKGSPGRRAEGPPGGEWVVNMKTISKIELKTRCWPPPQGQDGITCTMHTHKTTSEILGM